MNNSKNKLLLFLVAILLITNMLVLWYFVNKKPGMAKAGGHGDRPGSVTNFLKNEIGFSATQMASFDSLKKEHRAATKPYFEELAKSKDSFYQLIGKETIPDSVLQATAAIIGQKQAILDMHFFQNFKSIRKLCTPEQQPKFDSLMPAVASKLMEPWRRTNNRKPDSTSTNR